MPSPERPAVPISLFYSYSHKDEALRDELETHLTLLRRQGVVRGWHDRRIVAGTEWEGSIDHHLDTAGVILLLVSADFLASEYCYEKEMKRALERHRAGAARVIPVILRPCQWDSAPFGKLQALPKDGRPVITWGIRDEAFADITRGIREVVARGPGAGLMDTYRKLHEELVQLASEASRLEGQEPGERERLTALADAIREDRFKIVLFSPFQGGKSTIFNTVCGGGEFSPVGVGLKTSAAVAEAHDVESKANERAEVEWRTDVEMLLGFLEPLRPYLPEDQRDEGRPLTSEELAKAFRLGDPTDRRRLQEALDRAWARYEADPKAHPSDYKDILRIGRLTLRHYDAAYLANKGTSSVSITIASSWIRFPERWARRDIDEFRPDELIFLYLKRVRFFLRADGLRALQAVLVDCPGSHASAWDTAVTNDCLRHADAVVFLLGTEARGLSETDLADAESLAKDDLGKNLFVGFNIKAASEAQGRKWKSDALARLKGVGLDVPEDRVSIFNANLALRAQQLRDLLRHGRLPDNLAEALAGRAREVLAPRDEDAQTLAAHLVKREAKLGFETFTDSNFVGEWTQDQVDRMEADSGWGEFLRKAADFVAKRRARVMLLDRGTFQLRKVLDGWRARLGDVERGPETSAELLALEESQANAALARLDQVTSDIMKGFADELRDRETRRPLASELHERLQGRQGHLERRMMRAVERADSREKATRNVIGCLREHVSDRIDRWKRDLSNNESEAAAETIDHLRAKAESAFSDAMRQIYAEGGKILEGVVFRPGVLFEAETFHKLVENEADEIDEDDYEVEDADDLGDTAPDPTRPRSGWKQLQDWLWCWWSKGSMKAAISDVKKRFLDDAAKKIAKKYVKELMRRVARRAVESAKADAARFRRDVEARIEQDKANLSLSLPEKKERAGEARRIREEILEPFRGGRLDVLNRQVEATL